MKFLKKGSTSLLLPFKMKFFKKESTSRLLPFRMKFLKKGSTSLLLPFKTQFLEDVYRKNLWLQRNVVVRGFRQHNPIQTEINKKSFPLHIIR